MMQRQVVPVVAVIAIGDLTCSGGVIPLAHSRYPPHRPPHQFDVRIRTQQFAIRTSIPATATGGFVQYRTKDVGASVAEVEHAGAEAAHAYREEDCDEGDRATAPRRVRGLGAAASEIIGGGDHGYGCGEWRGGGWGGGEVEENVGRSLLPFGPAASVAHTTPVWRGSPRLKGVMPRLKSCMRMLTHCAWSLSGSVASRMLCFIAFLVGIVTYLLPTK